MLVLAYTLKIWHFNAIVDTGVETQEINDTEVEAEGSDMSERVEDDFEETFLSEEPAVPSSSGEHSTRSLKKVICFFYMKYL